MSSLLRRIFSSLNLLVTLVLVGTLFILLNFISSHRYFRKDLSRQKITVLSQQTVQTLKTLNDPLRVVVFYQPNHRLYELIKDQLKEYERISPQVKIKYVDPQQDPAETNRIIKEFDIKTGDLDPNNPNLLIVQYGTRHKYLSDTDLADYDNDPGNPMAGSRVKNFKGEGALTSAIINVTQKKQTLIWFTTGHGEKELIPTEQQGLSSLKKILDQQNFSTAAVNLLEKLEIGPEVKLLIVAGPTHRFTETEIATLDKYLNAGGGLLALLDPMDASGLDVFLKQWGISVGNNIVVDPQRQLPYVSAANLFVTDYTDHPIVNKMKTLMTLFPLARSVSPTEPPPAGITATALALTSPAGWGETQTSNERFQFKEGEDLKGPVSIAAAVERANPVKTRVVAIGDSDFLINAQIDNVGNRDLIMGCLYWLTEQEQLIGISPRSVESIKLSLTSRQLSSVFWFSFAGLPAFMGLLGAGMWYSRRQ